MNVPSRQAECKQPKPSARSQKEYRPPELVSDSLRQEAERGWANSARAANERTERSRDKLRMRAKRREAAQQQKREIADLKRRLERPVRNAQQSRVRAR